MYERNGMDGRGEKTIDATTKKKKKKKLTRRKMSTNCSLSSERKSSDFATRNHSHRAQSAICRRDTARRAPAASAIGRERRATSMARVYVSQLKRSCKNSIQPWAKGLKRIRPTTKGAKKEKKRGKKKKKKKGKKKKKKNTCCREGSEG